VPHHAGLACGAFDFAFLLFVSIHRSPSPASDLDPSCLSYFQFQVSDFQCPILLFNPHFRPFAAKHLTSSLRCAMLPLSLPPCKLAEPLIPSRLPAAVPRGRTTRLVRCHDLSPLLATLMGLLHPERFYGTKTPGVWGYSSHSGTAPRRPPRPPRIKLHLLLSVFSSLIAVDWPLSTVRHYSYLNSNLR